MKRLFYILCFLAMATFAQATDYYASPTGGGTACTLASPCTIATAVGGSSPAGPGDTIYLRGGTYAFPAQLVISRSGTSGNPIRLFNYPGEVPILDGSTNPNEGGHSVIRVESGVNWWHFKGLEIKSSPGPNLYLVGTASNITIEMCNIHHSHRLDNSGASINIEFGSNILILNNDVHHNGVPSHTNGGSGLSIASDGTGNIIRGNRFWRNGDNGFDLWDAQNVLAEYNWIWEIGYDDNMNPTAADGVGVKLGGGVSSGGHTIRYNLSWKNRSSNYEHNSATVPITLYHNTSWDAASGYGWVFGSTVVHVLRNNIAFDDAVIMNAEDDQYNSWNNPPNVTITSNTFISSDFSANLGNRQADGSLPISTFLKLNPNAPPSNNAIDKGTNIGQPFYGTLPDLGAYEFNPGEPPPPPPVGLVIRQSAVNRSLATGRILAGNRSAIP